MNNNENDVIIDESDIDFIQEIRVPVISEGCLKASRLLMYLTFAAAATAVAAIVIINFTGVTATVASAHRMASSIEGRQRVYMERIDSAFDETDAVVRKTLALVSNEILPLMANTTVDARDTMDKFLRVLKTYSDRGRVTIEVPL
jgi:hypothetical protein